MRVTADDGVALEVLDAGEPGRPPLMFVHGFGGAKEDFTDHVDALGATHRVVVFDHRGHGESDHPTTEGAYSLARFADDVVAVADALGLGTFRLLGNSMGGLVAQLVVLAHPERVEALILQDTWPGRLPFDRDDAVKAAEIVRRDGLAELQRRTAGRDAVNTPAHEELLRTRPGYAEFCDQKFLGQAPAMYAAIVVEMFDQPDRTTALGGVTCPALVMAGEQDPARPFCEAIARAIPGARYEVIADAGHSPQLERPGAWLAALTNFLSGLDHLRGDP